ncbi:hypothetical protein [Butyrivibrio sp. TB]|uniref:hypothetical protein n=1 Tax=Butyrivibrio sp. TB TaxID=1520809 RepID=UPI0008D45B24|nr:hypothetical protein [Butyrivibrio sp. TB]SEQ67043.1 hypothetical protein SAMN02910382_03736 [Butyrivibrio sp. TB]
MIKRFKEVSGLYIEKIYGQDRLAFAMSDTSDLYDLVEYAQHGGCQGFVILGYIDGEQPVSKPRKPGRVQIIE